MGSSPAFAAELPVGIAMRTLGGAVKTWHPVLTCMPLRWRRAEATSPWVLARWLLLQLGQSGPELCEFRFGRLCPELGGLRLGVGGLAKV